MNTRLKVRPSTMMIYAILLFFAVVVLLPFMSVVFSSFRHYDEVILNPMAFPPYPTFVSLQRAWIEGRMARYTVNSIIVIIPRVLLTLIISSMAGFAFAKLPFIGREKFYIYILLGLMVPFQAVMIPLYYSLMHLNIANTYWALILPGVGLSMPFCVFLMRAFYTDLPNELMDAAKIDGCGAYRTFFYVMQPLAGPGLTSLMIFQFLWGWNDFILPLLLITDENLRTLPLAVNFFTGRYSSRQPLIAACVVIASVPIIFLFIAFQRKFTEGVTVGAVKG